MIEGHAERDRACLLQRRGNRLDRDKLEMLGLPSDADVYLCGPGTFMDAMRAGLLSLGFVP